MLFLNLFDKKTLFFYEINGFVKHHLNRGTCKNEMFIFELNYNDDRNSYFVRAYKSSSSFQTDFFIFIS